MNRICIAALAIVGAAAPTFANTYTIDWLNQGPTPFGSSIPNNSNFFLPGVGNVNVNYSISSDFAHARFFNSTLQNGSVTVGPDTRNWTSHELFGATLLSGPSPLVPVPWTITYTFPNTLPAQNLYVGISGLGSTTSDGGGSSTATVNQNGTWCGEEFGGNNWGPNIFTPGAGTFSLQNSLSAPGGIDPHWNTALAVVRIDDAVNSLTVNFSQIRGDGVGVNIGYVPAPGAAAMLALAGLTATRRRR